MKLFNITTLVKSIKFKWPICTRANCMDLSKNKNFTGTSSSLKKATEEKDSDSKALEKINTYLPPEIPEEAKEVVESLKKGNDLYPYKSHRDRFFGLLKKDIDVNMKNLIQNITGLNIWGKQEFNYFPRHTDILIIGGGLVGLSVAYALKTEFLYSNDIIVLDKDPNAPFGSMNLGSATLSHQNFMYEEEIDMSKYCAEFLSSFPIHTMMVDHESFRIPYEPLGSLVLADDMNAEMVLEKCKVLEHRGVPIRLLNQEEMKWKFPWLNPDGVLFGSLALLNEGLIDPWAVAAGMKAKMVNMGIHFVTGEAIDFGTYENFFRRIVCRLPDKTYNSITFSKCIIAAGMGSGKLINTINAHDQAYLKVKIPEVEKKRYEYCFYDPNGPGLNTPIIMNPDGVYFRREGLSNLYVAGLKGISCDEGNDGKEYEIFDEKLKPFLIGRLNFFKELKLKSGWIDAYTNNKANDIGVIGHHPCNPEILFAIGFTKEGWRYAPAVGRALMELLFYGHYKTIDLSRFQVENLWLRQHLEVENKKRELLEAETRQAVCDS